MANTVDGFFDVVFDKGQFTCFAKHAKGTKIFGVDVGKNFVWPEFFSINAIDGAKDHEPIEEYHDIDKPRRADANVICFRNILLEFDKLGLMEQMTLVKNIGVPYSTCTFSGSKSFHFLICLKEPLKTKDEYDELVRRVFKAIPEADQANKNPSRLSRIPNAYREGKKTVQKLAWVLDRVDNEVLEKWLIDKGVPKEEKREKKAPSKLRESVFAPDNHNGLFQDTLSYMKFGSVAGQRNQDLFRAAANMFECGWTYDDVAETLQRVADLSDREFDQCLKSAFRKAGKE